MRFGVGLEFEFFIGLKVKNAPRKTSREIQNHRDLKGTQTCCLAFEAMPCKHQQAHHKKNQRYELAKALRVVQKQQFEAGAEQAQHEHSQNHRSHAHGFGDHMTERRADPYFSFDSDTSSDDAWDLIS
jgi:hypothetical protein